MLEQKNNILARLNRAAFTVAIVAPLKPVFGVILLLEQPPPRPTGDKPASLPDGVSPSPSFKRAIARTNSVQLEGTRSPRSSTASSSSAAPSSSTALAPSPRLVSLPPLRRRRPSGERGAWCSKLCCFFLTLRWSTYHPPPPRAVCVSDNLTVISN